MKFFRYVFIPAVIVAIVFYITVLLGVRYNGNYDHQLNSHEAGTINGYTSGATYGSSARRMPYFN